MPWLGYRFETAINKHIKREYPIRGVPTLLLLNAEGKSVGNLRPYVRRYGKRAY